MVGPGIGAVDCTAPVRGFTADSVCSINCICSGLSEATSAAKTSGFICGSEGWETTGGDVDAVDGEDGNFPLFNTQTPISKFSSRDFGNLKSSSISI